MITDMKIELDQAQHLNDDQATFEKFPSFLKKADLIAMSLHIYNLVSSHPGVSVWPIAFIRAPNGKDNRTLCNNSICLLSFLCAAG
jgi:hypothetical protein